jgi:hypothetical protein
VAALVARECEDADLHQGLGARREQHEAEDLELEEAFKNVYLDEEGDGGGSGGTAGDSGT